MNLFILDTALGDIQTLTMGAAGGSFGGGISQNNRYVAFQSIASNIVEGDLNHSYDIFLRDLATGATVAITAGANENSDFPDISSDAGWIVFESLASNLSPGDTNSTSDLFAWKRSDGSMRRITPGTQTDLGEFQISSDGKFVLFTMELEEAAAYIHDFATGVNRKISGALTNIPGLVSNAVLRATLSGNDRYVFFSASRSNNSPNQLIRMDLADQSLVLITNGFGVGGSTDLTGPSVSHDGQFAAFANGTNVFHWSAASGEIQQVDIGDQSPSSRVGELPLLSPDGKYVAFLSNAELISGVANNEAQLYVHDTTSGATRLVTRSPSGIPTFENEAAYATFSPDSKTLVFETSADNIVSGDQNNRIDLFAYSIADDSISLLSKSRAIPPVATQFGHSSLSRAALTANGRFVAFHSFAKLSPNDTNNNQDVYIFDRVLETNRLASAAPNGFTGDGSSFNAMISSNGTLIVFESNVRGLAGAGDDRAGRSVYVRDLVTGAIRNISGSYVGDLSLVHLTPGGSEAFYSIGQEFVRYRLEDNAAMRLGRSAAFPGEFATSHDGTHVAFRDLTALRLHDFSINQQSLVETFTSTPLFSADGSILVTSRPGAVRVTNLTTHVTNIFPIASMLRPVLSANGRMLAYETRISNLTQVATLDLATGENKIISRNVFGRLGNGSSGSPSIDAEGRFIAFESEASNFVAGDYNAWKDTFVYDRLRDDLTLLSRAFGKNTPGNITSINPQINYEGSTVFFASAATDLIPGDVNDSIDIFALNLDRTIPPRILAIQIVDAISRKVVVSTTPGLRYQLEFKPALDAPAWSSLGQPVVAGSDQTEMLDSNSATEGFYRIALVR